MGIETNIYCDLCGVWQPMRGHDLFPEGWGKFTLEIKAGVERENDRQAKDLCPTCIKKFMPKARKPRKDKGMKRNGPALVPVPVKNPHKKASAGQGEASKPKGGVSPKSHQDDDLETSAWTPARAAALREKEHINCPPECDLVKTCILDGTAALECDRRKE